MLNFKVYLEEEAPKNPKPGDIWQTKGGFRGVNQSGNRQTFQDKEKTKAYVATKDAPKDEPKKDKKEPETEPTSKKEPKVSKPTGEVRESVPKQNPKNVKAGYDKVKPSIDNQISKIDDAKTKETAEDVQRRVDQFVNAETDEEKEEIVRYLADNNLIQTNTEDPKASAHKIYFDIRSF